MKFCDALEIVYAQAEYLVKQFGCFANPHNEVVQGKSLKPKDIYEAMDVVHDFVVNNCDGEFFEFMEDG